MTGQATGRRPLRIGVPKGSLFKDSLRLLAAAGVPVSCLEDPGRQLIFREGDFEFVILRPTDVPTFVALGAADCAICGEDSIIEAGMDVVELVDLKFGGCRFVVAEPSDEVESVDDSYASLGVMKVATKYPNITRAYYDSIGTQVEIVKLHGNIELAPLCQLADRIVDITATGTTLRENNLRIVDDVMESTARFIANSAAVRVDERVREVAEALAESVE
ncbi:MAG: ATP phosphoribosyltransferase [Coriobacteriales bacterium]|jgi:ATP phosphoribosyltransferase